MILNYVSEQTGQVESIPIHFIFQCIIYSLPQQMVVMYLLNARHCSWLIIWNNGSYYLNIQTILKQKCLGI